MTDPTALPNFMPYDPAATPNGVPRTDTPVRDRVLGVLQSAVAASERAAQEAQAEGQPVPARLTDVRVDADGDLEYQLVDPQGATTTLFARVAEGDLALVRFFGQWQLSDPVSPDRTERIERCNDLTLQLNLVKLTMVQESLIVSSEHVITPNADLDVLVTLSINHILAAVSFFFQSWMPVEDSAEQ